MAAQRPYRQRRQYLTPTAWELTYHLQQSHLQLNLWSPYKLARCKWICCKCPYTLQSQDKNPKIQIISLHLIFSLNLFPLIFQVIQRSAQLTWVNFIYFLKSLNSMTNRELNSNNKGREILFINEILIL